MALETGLALQDSSRSDVGATRTREMDGALDRLPSDWVLAALERVESWKLQHVCAELVADSVDAAAAA
jgi:hypothetical protein